MTTVMIITDHGHSFCPDNQRHCGGMKKSLVLRSLIAVVLMFGCAYAPALVFVMPVARKAASGELIGEENAGILLACLTLLIGYSLSTVIAIVATRILTRRLDNNPISSLGLRIDRNAVSWFLAMIIIAVIILAVVTGLLKLMGINGQPQTTPGDTWWAGVLITFSLAFLLQGIPEEVVFRGWLIPSMGNTRLAVSLSVLVFTVMHLVSKGGQQNFLEHIIYLAVPFGFAVAAAVVRVVSGSTWAAIGVHAGFHMAGLLAFFLPVENSPAQWVFVGVAWTIVGVIIGWRFDFLGKLDDQHVEGAPHKLAMAR